MSKTHTFHISDVGVAPKPSNRRLKVNTLTLFQFLNLILILNVIYQLFFYCLKLAHFNSRCNVYTSS